MIEFPTDKQIYELWKEVAKYSVLYSDVDYSDVRNVVREALKRWGTPEPVALKDREPQPSDLDKDGCCWWGDSYNEVWEYGCAYNDIDENLKQFPETWTTHWLPHWAIKLPNV